MKKIRTGIAIMLTVLLAFLLCSCAGNTDRAKNGVKITATDAKTEQTEEYNDAVFSMTIPKGWKVTCGGFDIYHSIRISDPDEPLNWYVCSAQSRLSSSFTGGQGRMEGCL